jgi:tetratricopeptide (TPR) repeat protein
MLQQDPRNLTSITGERVGDQLERLEVLLGKLGMGLGPDEALEIPVLMDQVYLYIQQTDPENQGGKSASAQFDTFSQTYKKHLAVFLREVGDPAKLEAARIAANPPVEHWWWWPEEALAAQRRNSVKQGLRTLAIVVGILAVLVIVYQLFLQPDPKVIAAMNAQRDAEMLAQTSKDYPGAVARIDQGLTQSPGNSDLLVLKGALLTLIGDREKEANALFDEAEKQLGNREMMLLMKAQNYSILGKPDLSQSTAMEAIGLNPQSAQGYLILGQALEDQRDTTGAYAAYEKASTLGMENNDPTVTAQARMKMGMLMQSMNLVPDFGGSTPSATP